MRQRPINLNLLSIDFPLTAIVSLLHRISGLLLIFFIPMLLFVLQESLASEATFANLTLIFSHPMIQVSFWILLSALGYHLVAGIRHILMDLHFGDSLWAGRLSAKLTVFFGLLIMAAGGFWIWWR
jgi:succinate dehydrogenase / fumarate reductase cytochrome b subunit